jgi:hypothetical protein
MLLPSASRLVYLDVRPPSRAKTRSLLMSDSCGFVDVGVPSTTRRCVCHLQLLMGLARAVIIGCEPHGADDRISVPQIRDSFNLEIQIPPPPLLVTCWPSYIYRHWLPFSLPPTTQQSWLASTRCHAGFPVRPHRKHRFQEVFNYCVFAQPLPYDGSCNRVSIFPVASACAILTLWDTLSPATHDREGGWLMISSSETELETNTRVKRGV